MRLLTIGFLLFALSAVSRGDSAARPPREVVNRFFQGQAWMTLHKCSDIIDRRPNSPWAWQARGEAWIRLGLYPQACEDLGKSLELCRKMSAQEAPSLYLLGVALQGQGKTAEARGSWEGAAKVKGSTPENLAARSLALEDLGRHEEARALVSSGDSSVLCFRGEMLLNQGKYVRSVEEFNQAHKAAPADQPILAHRGLARLAAGEIQEARGDLKHPPGNPYTNPWATWGLMFGPPSPGDGYDTELSYDLADSAQGLDAIERILRSEPQDPFYYEEKAYLLERAGQLPQAKECLAQAAALKKL